MLNGVAVRWQLVRQQVTALSSAKAESYTALVTVAGTEVVYMCRMLEELGFKQQLPTTLWEDSMAYIFLSSMSVMYN